MVRVALASSSAEYKDVIDLFNKSNPGVNVQKVLNH